MGEYTHKGGATVKIATMDEAFWSRAELLKAQADGWRKVDGESYDNLESLLADAGTLYALPPRTAREFDESNLEYPTPRVWFTARLELAAKIDHRPDAAGTIGHPDHFQRIYLPCPYTPKGRVFCNAQPPQLFRFAAIGERYTNGDARTVFSCHGCERLFSLDQAELDGLDATNAFEGEGESRRQWLPLHARPTVQPSMLSAESIQE